jgi:hypothetical protein
MMLLILLLLLLPAGVGTHLQTSRPTAPSYC